MKYDELQREIMSACGVALEFGMGGHEGIRRRGRERDAAASARTRSPAENQPLLTPTATPSIPAVSLKMDLFEGCRFEFSKPLNNNFALSHSLFMGNLEVPTAGGQALKMPVGTYDFGAHLVTNGGTLLLGRVGTDGRLTGRVKYDVSPAASLKGQFQVAGEAGMSQGMFDLDLKGADWNASLKYGSSAFYGANYFQSVTPTLALGGEAFYLAEQRRSGVGLAARHATDAAVSTLQVANTGIVAASYLQKVSDKASLAADFSWNMNSREAVASFGYDLHLRQARVRGRVDTDGKIGALLEERLNPGLTFVLSAELDHWRKDYKFGFGLTVGE